MKIFFEKLKRIFTDKGLLLTFGLSLTLLFIFYGKLLQHPSRTYFGAQGDGMQVYYQTLYHTQFDTEFWQQKSINYPYGESIFFTSAMPFVNNVAKIVAPDEPAFGIALINLMMLFSPVIGALFIYAIFRHLRLPWFYGALAAAGIAFLSPQMLRMNGHYALTWVFLIPALVYLLFRFYDFPTVLKSFGISALVFLGASTHLYFLVFFATLGGAYWAVLFFTRDMKFGKMLFVVKHISIQFILPVIIMVSLVSISDQVNDRTAAPWGYFVYHSNLAGILFPFGRPYEYFIRSFCKPDSLETEGLSFIGIAAIIGSVAIFIVQFAGIFKGKIKKVFFVSDNKVLNIFFWASVFLLWISFGHPFIHGREHWLPFVGPLRQFRAVGRFAWLFFYIINIISVYRLYQLVQQKKVLTGILFFVIPTLLYCDVYFNIHGAQKRYNNRIAALEDESNLLPENSWLKKFNPLNYQAILPLPYFHIGSENIGRTPADPEIIKWSYVVSLKTGLPMMGVCSGRVSMGQTLKMMPIILDPIKEIPVLNDLPDKRPLLLVVREGLLDENELRILSLANPIGSSDQYKLFSLHPDLLRQLRKITYDSIKRDYESGPKYPSGIFTASDSSSYFYYQSFDNRKGEGYFGTGSYQGKIHGKNLLYDSSFAVPGNYVASFWMNHIGEDIYPRMVIEIVATDPSGKVPPYRYLCNAMIQMRAIDGNWGLEEFPITIPVKNSHLEISVYNSEMKRDAIFEIDELLIRKKGNDLYKVKDSTIFKNNRTYPLIK